MYHRVGKRNPQHVLYLPEHLDLDLVLNKHHDEGRWFVHSIFIRRVLDRREPDGWVPLHSRILKGMMGGRTYLPIVEALMNAGVVECDGKWTRTEKSKGYRLTEFYREMKHRKHVLAAGSTMARRIDQWREEKSLEVHLDVHRHLQKQFDALDIASPGPELELDPATAQQVNMIQDQEFYFVPCQYGRVHHNLSSLDSRLRPYLRVCGRPLVNLDIRNSQPLLASVLLLMYFTNNCTFISISSFKVDQPYLPEEFLPSPTPSPHTLSGAKHNSNELSTLSLPPDVIEYITLTQDGELYDALMARWGIEDRQAFKKDFFANVMYCRDHRRYEYGRRFEKEFPNVMEVFEVLKRGDYTQAPKMLQRVESTIMVNRVGRRVMNELPDAPVFTIHDSVLTLPEHAGPITEIIRQEFGRVGLFPTIKYEAYQAGPLAC